MDIGLSYSGCLQQNTIDCVTYNVNRYLILIVLEAEKSDIKVSGEELLLGL